MIGVQCGYAVGLPVLDPGGEAASVPDAASRFGSRQWPATLHDLLDEVNTARAAQRLQQKVSGANPGAVASAQLATLSALEEYVSELDRRAWPVPPAIRDDLRLHRALCGTQISSEAGRYRPQARRAGLA